MKAARFSATRLAMVVCSGLFGERAVADGKVFQVAAAPAEIPSQSALIHFADGVETLAIETRFVGQGTDFAWVVPLPSAPEVTPATSGLFPTLRATAVPELARPVNLLLAAPVLILVAWMLVDRRQRRSVVVSVALVAAVVVATVGLLPALGKARGGSDDGGEGVTVLDRRVVGSFEVATLGAAGVAPLMDWLKAEGFGIPDESAAAVERYVKDGWLFAACKLRRDADTGAVAATHPLVFKFRSPSAVYPMRLTGAGATKPLSLELYVFGDRAARCRGMQVERCLPTVSAQKTSVVPGSQQTMPVVHPTLARLVGDAPVMTKLVGTFAPAQMDRDFTLEWVKPEPVGDHAYSASGAGLVGAQWGIAIALAGSLVAGVLAAAGRMHESTAKQIAVVSLAAGVGVGVVVFNCLPVTPVSDGRYSRRQSNQLERVGTDVSDECEKKGGMTFVEFRVAFDERMRVLRELGSDPVPREEDSPGNYAVREDDGFAFLYVYNGLGGEDMVTGWRLAR